MITFDQEKLTKRLKSLDPMKRVVFAAACATRLLPAYRRYSQVVSAEGLSHVEKALEWAWRVGLTPSIERSSVEHDLERVMSAIPPQDGEEWTPLHAYAENAATATAYALRAYLTGDPREAAWAASQCYEATDLLAQNETGADFSEPGETQLLAHRSVQNELAQQVRDLQELEALPLSAEVIQSLKRRALASPAL